MDKNLDKIIVKVTTLINKVYPALTNFRKYERQCMVRDIRQNCTKLITDLNLSKKSLSMFKRNLTAAQNTAETLNSLFYISYKRKYISIGFYKEIGLILSDIVRSIDKLFIR